MTNGRRDEYDDLLKQLQKVSKKVSDESSELENRIQAFEMQVMLPNEGRVTTVADNDLLFLKQEVNRNKISLNCVKANNDEVLADSQDVNKEKLIER